MDSFKKPKTPPPFNMDAAGDKQQTQNEWNIATQATNNRPNQYGEDWNVSWQRNPDGSFSQTSSLTDAARTRRDANIGAGQYATEAGLTGLGNAATSSALNSAPGLGEFLPGGSYTQPGQGVRTVMNDPQGFMRLGAQGIYGFTPTANSMDAFQKADDYWSAVEEPRMQRQRDQAETKLKTQGFSNTDQAYREGMDDLASQQGEARGRFVQNAQGQFWNQDQTADTTNWARATGLFGLGAEDANRRFGQNLQQATFGAGRDDAARNAAQFGVNLGANLTTADLNRQMTASSDLARLGLAYNPQVSSTPNLPGFSNVSVPNVDYTQLYQQQQNDLWKQFGVNQKNYENTWNTIGNIAGTAATLGMPGGGTLGGNAVAGLTGLGGYGQPSVGPGSQSWLWEGTGNYAPAGTLPWA